MSSCFYALAHGVVGGDDDGGRMRKGRLARDESGGVRSGEESVIENASLLTACCR